MKKTVRNLAIIICVIAVLSAAIPVNATAEGQGIYTETFGYTQMKNDAQRAAYVKIAKTILSQSDEGIVFEPDEGVTKDDVTKILHLIPYDYPEAFYFRGSCSLVEMYGVVFIVPLYTTNVSGNMTVEEQKALIVEQKKQLDSAVKQIVSNVPSYVDTDAEKATYVFEFLAKNVEYVKGDHDQTAYGALVNKKCVCAGYASAYTILMRELGVKTWMVTGEADNGILVGPHAWNVSWINNQCVYSDPTWGDGESKIRYKWLNISGKKMNETHTMDEVYNGVLYDCDHNLQGFEAPTIKATGILLNATTKKFTAKKQTWQISASVVPDNAANKGLKYSSDNKSVATVSATGLVTAVGEGSTTIVVKSADGGAMATVTITVDFPEHKHILQKIKRVEPTCTEDGCDEYYVCSECKAIFRDSNAKTKLTDINQLKISAAGHQPGNVLHDEDKHWTECRGCDKVSQIEPHHFDGAGECSVCRYQAKVEIPQPSVPDTKPTEPTEPIEEPSVEPDAEKETVPMATTSNDKVDEEGTVKDEEKSDSKYDGKELSSWQVILIVSAIIGIFVVSILFIPAEKKK